MILENERKNNKNFYDLILSNLEKHNIFLSKRTIQRYVSGEGTPSYEVAKIILNALKVPVTEQEILKLLNSSKTGRNDHVSKSIPADGIMKSEKRPVLKKRITIGFEMFDFLNESEVPRERAVELVEERVAASYGTDKSAFCRYIKDLINEDMKKW